MKNLTKRSILMLVVSILNLNLTFAQDGGDLDGLVQDSKNDLLVVVGAGLAGAVLGLSTLSFVEEPKEHTNNIVVGASIGIIAGVAVVALSQATKSRDMIYGPQGHIKDAKDFDSTDRFAWHSENQSHSLSNFQNEPLKVNYTLRF